MDTQTSLYRVREVKESDVSEIVELGAKLHAESLFSHMRYDEQRCKNVVRWAHEGNHGLWMRVVESGGHVVGFLLAQAWESFFGPDKVANDLIMVIDKPHRGHAFIAIQEMVEQYHAWARKNGALRVYLSTTTGIEPEETAKLYETLGFRQIGTIHEA